jgi:hypothetical protein
MPSFTVVTVPYFIKFKAILILKDIFLGGFFPDTDPGWVEIPSRLTSLDQV